MARPKVRESMTRASHASRPYSIATESEPALPASKSQRDAQSKAAGAGTHSWPWPSQVLMIFDGPDRAITIMPLAAAPRALSQTPAATSDQSGWREPLPPTARACASNRIQAQSATRNFRKERFMRSSVACAPSRRQAPRATRTRHDGQPESSFIYCFCSFTKLVGEANSIPVAAVLWHANTSNGSLGPAATSFEELLAVSIP